MPLTSMPRIALQLVLVLIAERAAGSSSPWAGYIQSLPEAPPSPLFWGAAERRLLEATQLLQSLEGYECVCGENTRRLCCWQLF